MVGNLYKGHKYKMGTYYSDILSPASVIEGPLTGDDEAHDRFHALNAELQVQAQQLQE